MVYTISYREQNLFKQLLISGTNISSVIVYCDANNITPQSINQLPVDVILNNPSLQKSYSVTLQDQSENQLGYQIYDTFENTISWINSQTGKTVKNISEQNKPFVNA